MNTSSTSPIAQQELQLSPYSQRNMTGSDTTLATPMGQQTGDPRPESSGIDVEKSINPEPEKESSTPKSPENEYPTGAALYTIFGSLFLAVLCTGLDRSILATALPTITSDFNSLNDVGWYGSAYLLTTCCFQLLFGKLYAAFSIKWVFLASISIFELGSVVCAAAPSSIALIMGRAVAGIGGAGLVSGALIMLARILPLEKRPKWTGAMGGAVGIAQIVAPTLGGVFTDKLTWRWCFWINLPLGGITIFTILFFVHLPADTKPGEKTTLRDFLEKFDLVGSLLLMPWVVCLLLALQWGGSRYTWSDWRIILLLVVFSVLFLVWVYVQIRHGDRATVPPRIIANRSMFCGVLFMFCAFAYFFIIVYYIPIWFQAVRDVSAYQSGINMLTTSAAMSITVMFAGLITGRIGYFVPCMIASAILCCIATGIIYTFDIHTSDATWIGILILLGIGMGLGSQQALMAAQTVFKGADISLAISVLIFSQTLAGTVFLSVAENVFHSEVVNQLRQIVPDVDPAVVLHAGASQLRKAMEGRFPGEVDGILQAYNNALQRVFLVAVILACFTALGAGGMKWTNLKKAKEEQDQDQDQERTEFSKQQGEGQGDTGLSRFPTA